MDFIFDLIKKDLSIKKIYIIISKNSEYFYIKSKEIIEKKYTQLNKFF